MDVSDVHHELWPLSTQIIWGLAIEIRDVPVRSFRWVLWGLFGDSYTAAHISISLTRVHYDDGHHTVNCEHYIVP